VNPGPPQWTKVFGDALTQLAAEDANFVTITAAMPSGTGTNIFQKKWPERFFDVGIAEAHARRSRRAWRRRACGPVVAIYRRPRAHDSIIHDVAIRSGHFFWKMFVPVSRRHRRSDGDEVGVFSGELRKRIAEHFGPLRRAGVHRLGLPVTGSYGARAWYFSRSGSGSGKPFPFCVITCTTRGPLRS